MKLASLQFRLLIAATVAVTLALAIAGAGLMVLFERQVDRRVGAELDTYLNQIAGRLAFAPDGSVTLEASLADPRFDKIYGGLYWQIYDEAQERYTRSRSLWDANLDLPAARPPVGAIHVHEVAGLQGAPLLVHERRLIFDTGGKEKVLRIAVAVDSRDVSELSASFGSEMGIALAVLAGVLVLAGWLEVNIGLKPLARVRSALAAVRAGEADRLELAGPSEIAPLVEEVNTLLEAQERSIRRARDRAGDLAHSFKTPLTALMGDARRLRANGEADIANDIERTTALMQGYIDRELARSRLRNTHAPAALDPGPVIRGLVNTLSRTPQGEAIAFEVAEEADLLVRIDREDLHEVLGNLFENAVRHARSLVVVRVARRGNLVGFEIEDDGPGIAEHELERVTARGRRIDSSPAGAGLGLAIVTEVLEHYGRTLRLERSTAVGGLKVSFDVAA